MKRLLKMKHVLPLFVAACVVSLLSAGPTLAGKGGKKPGGDTTHGSGYSIVALMPSDVPIWESWVGDLNELGDVVGGYEELDEACRAFHFDSTAREFKTLAGGTSAAGLNNFGEIVGADASIWDAPIGLYWSDDGATPQVVSPLSGDAGTGPVDINDAGIICGSSIQGDGAQHAVVWLVGPVGDVSLPTELPPLPGDTAASASELNELNEWGTAQVVGFSSWEQRTTAVVWTVQLVDGILTVTAGPTDLGSLAGGDSLASAVNIHGDICGHSDKWPFLKLAGGPMIPLSGLNGTDQGYAFDVNYTGQVVGSQRVLGKRGNVFNQLAVLWASGEAIDLNNENRGTTGWDQLNYAYDINDSGYITGKGVNANFGSGNGAFLMTPK